MGEKTFRSGARVLVDSNNYKHCAATRLFAGKNSMLSRLVSSFDSAATPRTHLPIPSACDARQSSSRPPPTSAPRPHPHNPIPLHNPLRTADRKKICRTALFPSSHVAAKTQQLPFPRPQSHFHRLATRRDLLQLKHTSCATDRRTSRDQRHATVLRFQPLQTPRINRGIARLQ